MRLGVGYNFTDISDDLKDLSYDHQGWFVNVIAKFQRGFLSVAIANALRIVRSSF